MGQRRKDREAYWRGVLKRQVESGLNVAEFCRQESISAPGFYAWRRKLKERDVADGHQNGRATGTVSSRQLLPVRIESHAPATPVRILLPECISIETSAGVDVGRLSDVVRAVREASVC